MREDADFGHVAAILASAAYGRAASALVAGFEACDEHRPLLERQKAVLVEKLVAHFQGVEAEFAELLAALQRLAPSLAEDLEDVARARSQPPR